MKTRLTKAIATLAFSMMLYGTSSTRQIQAGEITNGSLAVTIREDNGAIDSAIFSGTDYFNPGTPVSNFGFQNDTDTMTFLLNNTGGAEGQSVTVTGGNIVSGAFAEGGANLDFVRSYSLVPGFNVLRVTTDFTNNGGDLTFSYFDTFDPDQGQPLGQGNGTFNDIFALGGGTVGQARIDSGGFEHTVIAGSLDSRVTVASGNPFQISNGPDLNDFFATPFDGNDDFDDFGTHIGIRTFLGSGQSTSFTYDLAFGLTPSAAQAAFTQANVPEPSTLILALFGTVSFGWSRRRRGN